MQIHERVRQIRQAKGITQTHVAKSIPVSVYTYNKAELGIRPFRIEWVEAVAKALDVRPGDFFCGSLDKTSNESEEGVHQQ